VRYSTEAAEEKAAPAATASEDIARVIAAITEHAALYGLDLLGETNECLDRRADEAAYRDLIAKVKEVRDLDDQPDMAASDPAVALSRG
jgi:hypothetical protein